MNYIYKITNKVNSKSYIGFTSQKPEIRWHEHWINSRCKTIKNTALYYAIRKYGWENFHKEVIDEHIDSDFCLNVLEEKYIKKFKTHISENGYNMTFGGNQMFEFSNPMKGRTHSLETKNKISQATQGRIPWNKGKSWIKKFNTKTWKITSPQGNEIIIQNLNEFCRKYDLRQNAMSLVASGKRKHHKNFKCEHVSKLKESLC